MRLTSPLNLPAPGRRQCVYGALRGFARTCVFAKQSLGPIICDHHELPARSRLPEMASLLPKLRDHYAEFLDPVSLVHLRLLASPTCVGLRYGRSRSSATGFSCVSTPGRLCWGCPRYSHSTLGLPLQSWTVNPQNRRPFVPRSPIVSTDLERGRNLRRLAIGYASGASP